MKGVEILVATPGRLLDHVESRNLMLNQVQMLVLDEADRMLDMGFMPDLRRILALLPKPRQTLLFSATFSDEIKKLAHDFLTQPVTVETARRNTAAETVKQSVQLVDSDRKFKVLADLIRARDVKQVLVFTRTKLTAARLARRLARDGIAADAIHGDKSQQERLKALQAFKAGEISVLVATDVAARGLDIDQLPLVINYELPPHAEDYVHRIGRTGRAGASGEALSLVDGEDERRLKEVEKLLKRELPREQVQSAGRSAAPADDWFLRPYEPSEPVAAKKEDVPPAPQKDQPKKQVAALLRNR